jgi:hypothetical protein
MKTKHRLTRDEMFHVYLALKGIVDFLTAKPKEQAAVPAFSVATARRLMEHFKAYL